MNSAQKSWPFAGPARCFVAACIKCADDLCSITEVRAEGTGHTQGELAGCSESCTIDNKRHKRFHSSTALGGSPNRLSHAIHRASHIGKVCCSVSRLTRSLPHYRLSQIAFRQSIEPNASSQWAQLMCRIEAKTFSRAIPMYSLPCRDYRASPGVNEMFGFPSQYVGKT